MRSRPAAAALAVLVWIGLTGCAQSDSPPEPVASAPEADAPAESSTPGGDAPPEAGPAEPGSWTFPLPVHPALPGHSLTVEGKVAAAGGEVAVRRVTISTDESDGPVQTFEDVPATPPLAALDAGWAVETVDMNFDEYVDFRIMELAPAGPNVRFLHWLYRPEQERFERFEPLDDFSGARFDASTRRITTSERAGPTEYVGETYEFSGDRLRLVRREVRRYTEPGRYRLTVSEPVEGRLQVIDERIVEEGADGT